MSGKLFAVDNFNTGNWTLNTDEITSGHNTLFIAFTYDAPVVSFKNLRFGYELKQNDYIIQYNVYPPAGIRYIRSDQEYLVSTTFNLQPEENYSLFLWATNDNTETKNEFDFITPRTKKPHDSWIWNSENKVWEAPVEKPELNSDDNYFLIWNESIMDWEQEPDYILDDGIR